MPCSKWFTCSVRESSLSTISFSFSIVSASPLIPIQVRSFPEITLPTPLNPPVTRLFKLLPTKSHSKLVVSPLLNGCMDTALAADGWIDNAFAIIVLSTVSAISVALSCFSLNILTQMTIGKSSILAKLLSTQEEGSVMVPPLYSSISANTSGEKESVISKSCSSSCSTFSTVP